MKTLIITATIASLIIAGCDRNTSNEPTNEENAGVTTDGSNSSPETTLGSQQNTSIAADNPAAAVISKDIKADSVQISYADNTVILGAIGAQIFAAFGNNGAVPTLLALGPVKVWIFKEIDPAYQEFMRDEYGVEVGGSYLEAGPDQFEFIRRVDITLSDEELAKQFGIE